MFKMRKKNKSGLEMNPVVGAVMIFVGVIAAGAITVMVMPLVNRGKDTKVMEGLTSLKTAISLFMLDTNGEAPCFNANVTEGTGIGNSSDPCMASGHLYDYIQGRGNDFNKNGVTGERFTLKNMLTPRFLDKIPAMPYSGENFIYTKGLNNTQSRSTAFAVSGLLHSDISSDAVRNNLSVLDVMGQSNFGASSPTTYTSCRSNDVNLSLAGYGTARVIEDGEGRFIYMNINGLTSTTFKDSTAGVNCDIYSEGQIFEGAFLANPSGSPSMNVQGIPFIGE